MEIQSEIYNIHGLVDYNRVIKKNALTNYIRTMIFCHNLHLDCVDGVELPSVYFTLSRAFDHALKKKRFKDRRADFDRILELFREAYEKIMSTEGDVDNSELSEFWSANEKLIEDVLNVYLRYLHKRS